MSGKPWTMKHRVEAWARIFELSAVAIRKVADPIPTAVVDPRDKVWTEAQFRTSLRNFGDFDPARINREVRRVRALAEGRLVRETVWSIRYDADPWDAQGSDEIVTTMTDADRAGIRDGGGRVVRVTRIRKA